MAEFCLDKPSVSVMSEWNALLQKFHTELQKTEHNWFPWAVLGCFYRGKVRRHIQIVISEMLLANGIDTSIVLDCEPQKNWEQDSMESKKQIAAQYCEKLIQLASNKK